MKSELYDITKKLFRQKKKVLLKPLDLTNDTYFIYYTHGKLLSNIIPEIKNYEAKKFITVSVNTQTIPSNHFIVETDSDLIKIKFIKTEISYLLQDEDIVELIGQIQ